MCIFSKISTWNVLFVTLIIVLPTSGISGIGHIFQIGGVSEEVQKQKNEYVNIYFFRNFLTPKMFMMEPI